MNDVLTNYTKVFVDIKDIIISGRVVAYNAANSAGIMTYWNIGKRIVEDEQQGAKRAEYGKHLISKLAVDLTKELENAILTHIRDFLMEIGRGFAFVVRQQHIITDTEDYYLDLFFYNVVNCISLLKPV